MATFDVNGDLDNIQEAVLLPNDDYAVIITQDPVREPNKVMREEGADADKAGYNIILRTRVYDPEVPEAHGRMFTIYLPLPNDTDEGKYTPQGQAAKDSKLDRIKNAAGAFSGDGSGTVVNFEAGMMAVAKVIQKVDRNDSSKKVNEINAFAGLTEYEGPRPESVMDAFS